jgi:hypothetical protein
MRIATVIPWRDKGDKRRRLNMEYVVNDLTYRGWIDDEVLTFAQAVAGGCQRLQRRPLR